MEVVMSKLDKDTLLGLGILAGFACTLYFAIDAHIKLNKAADTLKLTREELLSEDIKIDPAFVEDAVRKAADREASYYVSKAMDKAAKEIAEGYKEKIVDVVEYEFELQKADVAKQLKRKIQDIDISEIKRQVKIEAKEACIEKLKDDLDDLSDKYTEQIESMTSIYETVANKIQSIGD